MKKIQSFLILFISLFFLNNCETQNLSIKKAEELKNEVTLFDKQNNSNSQVNNNKKYNLSGEKGECDENKTNCNLGSCVEGDCEKGQGKIVFRSGSFYIGNFKDHKFNGLGALYFSSTNQIQICYFKNDYLNGYTYIYLKDEKLPRVEGHFLNDKLNGEGSIIYNDGTRYKGNFISSKREGKGILYNKDNKIIYDGTWKNNQFDGNGILYFNDISSKYYEGSFKDGKLDGSGIEFFSDGRVKYQGEFKNDKYNGKGKEFYISSSDNKYYKDYEGSFKDGEKEGNGIDYYDDGKITYQGEFRKGRYDGSGIKFQNDDKNSKYYEGNFKNGEFDGFGTYYYINGSKLIGEFKDSKVTQNAKFYLPDGRNFKVFSGNPFLPDLGDWYMLSANSEGSGLEIKLLNFKKSDLIICNYYEIFTHGVVKEESKNMPGAILIEYRADYTLPQHKEYNVYDQPVILMKSKKDLLMLKKQIEKK